MARQVLPVIGAAVGAYFGGPTGAQIGWTIGSLVGNAVDPQVIKGPSIGDMATQTSQEGVPRPIVYGVSPPMAGNITATGKPVIKKKRTQQGKGGPVTESEVVYRTYAIGICEGPINAILRVWRNGSLVYDARSTADPSMAKQNANFMKTARFFLGSWTQNPSPDIEAALGASNAPYFRGTAYLVMANEDLTDLRGAIPQYMFQVMRCEGIVYTSRPYAIEATDSITSSVGVPKLEPQPYISIQQEVVGSAIAVLSIVRFGGQQTYAAPNEDKVQSALQVISITRFGGEVNYAAPNEDKLQQLMQVVSITLAGGEVNYSSQTDTIQSSIQITSITRS